MQKPSLQFEIHPASGVPIYRQIIDQVEALVASQRLRAGDLLPSVRQMANELEINMMTVSKAYSTLELKGVLERVRGKGMRVIEQKQQRSTKECQAELRNLAANFVTRGQQLGLSEQQILAVVRSIIRERKS